MNTASTGRLLRRFVGCTSVRETYDFLKDHPEIVSAESVAALQQMQDAATRGGHEDAAWRIGRSRGDLEGCVALGLDPAFCAAGFSWVCLPDPALVPRANAVLNAVIAYKRTHEVSDLNKAIEVAAPIMRQAGFGRAPGALRAAIYFDTGSLFDARYDTSHDPGDLGGATDLWQRALDTAGVAAAEIVRYLTHYLSAHEEWARRTGSVTHLDEAIRRAEDSCQRLPLATAPDSAVLWLALASARRVRGQRTGDLADIEGAISAAETALRLWPPDDESRRASTRQILGNALQDRYLKTGSLADLDEAFEAFSAAVSSTPETADPDVLAPRLTSLANALRDRYARTGNAGDLDAAIEMRRKVLAITTADDPLRWERLANMGTNLRERYRLTQDADDIEESIASYETACQEAGRYSAYSRWACVTGLAAALRTRFAFGHQRADLERAIALNESALAEVDPGIPDRNGALANLANALWDRSRSFGTEADARRAIELYKTVLRSPLATPEVVVKTAANMIDVAAELQAWPDVATAALAGLDAIDMLVRTQLTRGQKETWLRDAKEMSSAAAFALTWLGHLEEALVVLETGRARLLSEAFESEGAGLDNLERAGRADLARKYRQAVRRVQQFALEADGLAPWSDSAPALLAQHRQALADLDETLAEIRQVPGFADFLAVAFTEEIAEAAVGAPLVYVTAADAGGLALIVSGQPRAIRNVWLPHLTKEELANRIILYVEALARGSLSTDQSVVDNLCRWLWDAVAGPIVAELASSAEIVLIPTGLLALLPLHAAWREDPGAPAGRVCLIDECAVTYAANARAQRTAKNRAARMKTTNYLVVEDPRPVSAGRLEYAGAEADAVLVGVPGRRLRHEQATKAQVQSALRKHSVLHFACHGSAKVVAPLESRVILAHDEPLTLGELMTDHLGQARLAVLSACATAIMGSELMDEVVNFPTGMLQAGAAACIGSLWQVSDVSTALLMRRFYELWRGGEIGPSEALRRAQRWLRDISNEELLEAGYASPPPFGDRASQVQAFWRKARPYYHPYYWAAFTFYGA